MRDHPPSSTSQAQTVGPCSGRLPASESVDLHLEAPGDLLHERLDGDLDDTPGVVTVVGGEQHEVADRPTHDPRQIEEGVVEGTGLRVELTGQRLAGVVRVDLGHEEGEPDAG